jgi:two-component system chemotaxis response regulator CheY
MILCWFEMARVMIADDSKAIRIALKDIILNGKHELVAEAADGAESVEKFVDLKPDVLLLDLVLPKKDGLTVLKEIKETNPNAKIIIITVVDNKQMIQDCISAGALAYVTKPFTADDVLKSISFAVK